MRTSLHCYTVPSMAPTTEPGKEEAERELRELSDLEVRQERWKGEWREAEQREGPTEKRFHTEWETVL